MFNTRLIMTVAVCISLSGCQFSDRFFGTSTDSDERRPPTAEDSVSSQYEFRYATVSDRSGGQILNGATLDSRGEYYIYLDTTDQNNGSVKFFINDIEVNSDNTYPYDLNGGGTLATAQDMSLFVTGSNRVSAQFKGRIVDEAIVTVESGTTTEPDPLPDPTYTMMVSSNADRSGASALDGTVLDSTASYYVFLQTDDTAADTVTFHLNGEWVQTDSEAPWDLAGGTESTAVAVDMSQFAEGVNELSVDVNGSRVGLASVTVETPTSDTEPTTTIDITLYWNPPVERENGEALSLSEIGGYEIRYRMIGAGDYNRLVINDSHADQHLFQDLEDGAYEFEIAAFDLEGLYSEFVTVTY